MLIKGLVLNLFPTEETRFRIRVLGNVGALMRYWHGQVVKFHISNIGQIMRFSQHWPTYEMGADIKLVLGVPWKIDFSSSIKAIALLGSPTLRSQEKIYASLICVNILKYLYGKLFA